MPTAAELTAHLALGRAEMETLMLDTVRITKPGEGARVFDEETMQYTDPPRVVVYEGKCRLQVKADINSNVVETTAGDREATYLTATLQLPIDADDSTVVGEPGDVRPDHVAEYLTCLTDATMVGRKWNIQGIYHKSQATHRRFRVREVIG